MIILYPGCGAEIKSWRWMPKQHKLILPSDNSLLQLSTSSLRIHGGAIFSAVSGRKSIPISAIEAPEHGAWYRLLGFYLTTTFCLNPAQQAVSYWNCRVCWRISRLEDHKYLPAVTNPYEKKTSKSRNKHGNFKGKRPVVLDLNKKLLSGKNRAPYTRPHAQALL